MNPTTYVGRVQEVKVKADQDSQRVELDVRGVSIELPPDAIRSLVTKLREALKHAEGI